MTRAQDWFERAACREVDPELFFFPESLRGFERRSRSLAAKTVCAACPVRNPCLAYAMDVERPSSRYGVWGGLTEEERSALARSGRRILC